MSVTVRAEHFDKLVTDFQDRDVERSAAEVEDRDLLVFLFLKTVGQRGGCRLVNDARDFQAGDLAGIFCRLSLSIVEVGRNCDDRFLDLVPQVAFRRLLQLLKDHRGNLRRRVFLAVDFDLHIVVRAANNFVRNDLFFRGDFTVTSPHESLDGVDRVVRIRDRLVLRRFANQRAAFIGEGNNTWSQAVAFQVRNHLRDGTFHHGNHRVRCTKVDADNLFTFCHL